MGKHHEGHLAHSELLNWNKGQGKGRLVSLVEFGSFLK